MNRMLVAMVGLATLLFISCPASAQSDTSRVGPVDSSGYNPHTIAKSNRQLAEYFVSHAEYLVSHAEYLVSHFGIDLFATVEINSLYFNKVGFFSMSGGGGLDTEVRLAPVFIGGIVGESGNEIPRPPSNYFYSSLYGGFMIHGYRIELGEVYGETSDLSSANSAPPFSVYKSYFAGVGRRYGSGFFFEPEIKVMFPVISAYYYYQKSPGIAYNGPNAYTSVGVDKTPLRNMFFAFGVKLGFCLGSGH